MCLCGAFDHLFLQGLQKETSTKSFQILLHPSVCLRGESKSRYLFIPSSIQREQNSCFILATRYRQQVKYYRSKVRLATPLGVKPSIQKSFLSGGLIQEFCVILCFSRRGSTLLKPSSPRSRSTASLRFRCATSRPPPPPPPSWPLVPCSQPAQTPTAMASAAPPPRSPPPPPPPSTPILATSFPAHPAAQLQPRVAPPTTRTRTTEGTPASPFLSSPPLGRPAALRAWRRSLRARTLDSALAKKTRRRRSTQKMQRSRFVLSWSSPFSILPHRLPSVRLTSPPVTRPTAAASAGPPP